MGLSGTVDAERMIVPQGRPMNDTPRRSVRVRLNAEVKVRRAADISHEVKLRDLSTHGCSVELVNPVLTGDRVWITLSGPSIH